MNDVLRRGLLLVTCLILGSGFVAACSESGLVGGDCRFGLTPCQGICVNIGSDTDNCGRCGNVCEAGDSCSIGVCLAGGDGGVE